jgi:uncharacterized repeat protein (TIGR03837 family)
MTNASSPPRWDLFCRVIDNFGDAGIAWRLAQELAHEHGLAVSLWIDEPGALARLVPHLVPTLARQQVDGVRVCAWPAQWQDDADADVVVEMFGAGLPEAFVAAMARRASPPHWFVLEYLSAESWVDAHHGLPSPHPRANLVRRVWFPGFSAATGGLLREHDLLARRDAFQHDASRRTALWRELGVNPPAGALVVSLFCYPLAPVAALLDAWAHGPRPVLALVPEGIARDAVEAWCAQHARRQHDAWTAGALTLARIPFVPQTRYDALLWSCDVNIVRGEDSFVRAQWAARAFAWHIYPQQDGAHVAKLDAFLARYLMHAPRRAGNALRGFWHALNAVTGAPAPADAWTTLVPFLPELAGHASRWSHALATLPELGATLVKAASERV